MKKLYRVVNTRTGEIVRYREEETKRAASSGLQHQERVELHMNSKQYQEHMKELKASEDEHEGLG